MNEVESALKERMKHGAPALTVGLGYCHVSPAQLQKLEEASGHAVEVWGHPDTWGVGESSDSEESEGDQSSAEGVDDD